MKNSFYIAIFSALLLVPTLAHAANFDVVYDQTPLFAESPTAPGYSVTRGFSVENGYAETKIIAVSLENFFDSSNLASVFDITIKQGEDLRFHGTLKQLKDFGEVPLSQVAPGSMTRYDVTALFLPTAGNEYQGAQVVFDLRAGLLGTPEGPPSTGGVGGNALGVYADFYESSNPGSTTSNSFTSSPSPTSSGTSTSSQLNFPSTTQNTVPVFGGISQLGSVAGVTVENFATRPGVIGESGASTGLTENSGAVSPASTTEAVQETVEEGNPDEDAMSLWWILLETLGLIFILWLIHFFLHRKK